MDESFGKSERLCLKRRFEALLAGGKSFYVYPFRVIFREKQLSEQDPPVQFAVAVKKKQFKKAVTRNLIKRRIRESWRRRKGELYSFLTERNNNLLVLLVYGADVVLPFSEIDRKMDLVIRRLEEEAGKSC